MFRDVPARPNYVELEQEVLRLWEATRAFEQLRDLQAFVEADAVRIDHRAHCAIGKQGARFDQFQKA